MSRLYLAIPALLAAMMTVASAASHVVGQKGKLFTPGALTVKTGEAVQFKNDDSVTHHIYSPTKGQEFSLETLNPGGSGSRTFSKKGRVDVRCGLHPGMRLVLTVR